MVNGIYLFDIILAKKVIDFKIFYEVKMENLIIKNINFKIVIKDKKVIAVVNVSVIYKKNVNLKIWEHTEKQI